MITNAIVWTLKKMKSQDSLAREVKLLKAILQATAAMRDHMHDKLEKQTAEWLESGDTIDTEIVYSRVREIIGR